MEGEQPYLETINCPAINNPNLGPLVSLSKVINLNVPDVGENILASLKTDDLIQCLEVSQAW